MPSTRQGSFHLFRLAGIDVFLHWSWFVVAAFEISARGRRYPSVAWNAAEYLTLFLVVILHEFGHALACRQVGGTANKIVLWPLGGIAHVDPPPRPAATLWSIAAGPLVNVALLGVSYPLAIWAGHSSWGLKAPHAYRLLWALCLMNLGLLIFNLLPIYPLDGGQILRSLLWFVLGRARSLKVVAALGLFGAVGLNLHCVFSPFLLDHSHLSLYGHELLDRDAARANIFDVGVAVAAHPTRQAWGGIFRGYRF